MPAQTYSIQEANADLPRLIEVAASGAEVIITEAGKPLLRISRVEEELPKIRFGVLKGKVKVAKDFDAPLPADLLSEFEGNQCAS